MADSSYKREQSLRAHGITIRRATNKEQQTNAYGEKLIWVVDLGAQRQARNAYRTKAEALRAAEAYL